MKKSDTDWKRLESMTDEEIDYSDIPELDEKFFRNAKIQLPKPWIGSRGKHMATKRA